jgi:hypothetical protein
MGHVPPVKLHELEDGLRLAHCERDGRGAALGDRAAALADAFAAPAPI